MHRAGWLPCTRRVLAIMLALSCCRVGAAGADPLRQVLVVYETQSTLPAVMEIAQGLRRRLQELSSGGLELYAEHLDIVRFPHPEHTAQLVATLAAKYRAIRPDVIMAAGPGALSFILDHRAALGLDAPIVFGAIGEAGLRQRPALPPDVSGVVSHFDIPRTMELARRLQPAARRIVVVTGSSDFDRRWEQTARVALGSTTQLDVEYWSGETVEGFLQKARGLSASDILLVLTIFKDEAGKTFIPRDAAARIAAAAGAPTYSVYGGYVGLGVVGGYVETLESVGEDMATLAYRLIQDGAPAPQIVRSTGGFMVDARQLARWGIGLSRLPAGTDLRFHEPGVWESHRPQILGVLAVLLLQSATIAALFVQGRRRRRAENELAVGRLELAHLSRTAQLGELSGAFAHELNQPLTSILANAEAGVRLLRQRPPDLKELREVFDDIVKDDRRAANVIGQLRRLMVKGELSLERVDLNEAVAATMTLASGELSARRVQTSFRRARGELPVKGNLAQLQQVVLNLLVNAADAMAHLPPPERAIEIRTSRREDGFSQLIVADRGHGMSPDSRESAFKPFFSTKPGGLGLGLAICRTIVSAHGGTLAFDERASTGARVVLSLPPA